MKYYIAENGQPAGPFEPSELMAHGLTVNSLVWGEGMPNWVSASQVPELVAMINGTPFNPGGIDTQMPQMPPMGGEVQLPQVPPFGGQQPTQPTPYGTPNQPYAPPQYGPSTNQPSNQVMPKTWLTEAVLATVLSFLCLCNIIAAIPGGIAASASAKKWVIIAVIVMVVWSCVQGYQLLTNPNLLQQIQEGSIGSLYGI